MKFQVSFGFFIFLAISVILIPIKWVLCWLIAQFFHELFHIAALKISKYNITSVRIGINGIVINGDFNERIPMIFCALAGPCAGIILFSFFGNHSSLGLCGLCQSAFNLLPVFPLDGGRALMILCIRLVGPQFGLKFFCVSELVFLTVGAAAFIYLFAFVSRMYFLFLSVCVYFLLKKLLAKRDGRLYNTNSFY